MRYPRLRPLPALLVAVVLAGCHGPALPLQRLVEKEPTEVFHTDLVTRRQVVFRWPVDSPADLSEWRIERAETVSPTAYGGALLRGARVDISRQTAIVTRRVDALEVDALALRTSHLQFAWALAGRPFRPSRQLSVPLRRAPGGFSTSTFHLRGLPAWRGKVVRIRFRLPSRGMGIREVRGVRMRLRAAALERAVARAWKVELDSEMRNARLAPPGSPIEWPVTVGTRSRLRLAYGVDPRTSGAIRFRISARRPGAEPVSLFEEVVAPDAEGAPRGWREATVALDHLDRGEWTLLLETEDVDGSFDPAHGLPAWGNPEILPRRRVGGPPNILLISLDTLRADHLSLYGYARPTSPNLARWAERSATIFDNAVAPTPSTLFSHASMLSGHWSRRTGVDRTGKVPRHTRLLAEYLRRAGYSTRAVTGGGWLHPLYGFSRGFDVYRYWPGSADKERELEEGVGHVERWLRSKPASPFLLFLHTYEVHSPFQSRQPYLESFGGPAASEEATWLRYGPASRSKRPFRMGEGGEPEEVTDEELRAYYDAGIAYTDALIGRVLDTLEETGLDRDTVVVLTSDHGESLGEGGRYGHGHLHDSNLLVPLVLALPGKGSGRHIPQQVSLADIVPTLLKIAGLPVPRRLDGGTLLPLMAGRADSHRPEAWIHSSRSGTALRISNRLKYIYRHSADQSDAEPEELYRLDRDPGETRNLAAGDPQTPRLRERARGFLRATHQGLRMSFDNSSDRTFRGFMEGGPLYPGSAMLAPEMPCRCVRPAGFSRAALEIPPGERFELFFEMSNASQLRLDGGLDGAPSLDETVDLTTLAEPWRWSDAGMEIAIWWPRGLEGVSEAAEPDPELMERLRDLGYVD